MKSITSIYLLGDKNKGKIGRIKEISNEITFYWNKIKEENVIPKEAKRNYELKAFVYPILYKYTIRTVSSHTYWHRKWHEKAVLSSAVWIFLIP